MQQRLLAIVLGLALVVSLGVAIATPTRTASAPAEQSVVNPTPEPAGGSCCASKAGH